MERRFHRSRKDKLIGGVCGGLADYFGIDPVIIRVVFVALALSGGIGLVAYVVLWIVAPLEATPVLAAGQSGAQPAAWVTPETAGAPPSPQSPAGPAVAPCVSAPAGRTAASSDGARVVFGVILLVVGVLLTLRNLGVQWFRWLYFIRIQHLWPVILIAIGVALLLRRNRGE